MKLSRQLAPAGVVSCLLASFGSAHAALVVTPTTDSSALKTALGGNGMTITSVATVSGAPEQFGTYKGFNEGPVTMRDGVTMSTGFARNVVGPASPQDIPDDDAGVDSVQSFDDYARSNIPGFREAFDVAGLKVDFKLDRPTSVSFDFSFGSVEFPNNSQYADAFFTFVDGTTNQIATVNGKPVTSGPDVASQFVTNDVNTAFGNPHGLLKPVTATTAVLAAGDHSLLFQIGDISDWNVDSAVFLSGLGAAGQLPGSVDPNPNPGTPDPSPNPVPVPAAFPLMAAALASLVKFSRQTKAV